MNPVHKLIAILVVAAVGSGTGLAIGSPSSRSTSSKAGAITTSTTAAPTGHGCGDCRDARTDDRAAGHDDIECEPM